MTSMQVDSLPKQSDLLYLIFKYLETVPGFDSTAVALRDDIIATSSLGNIIGWDGSERTSDIDDLARNYPNIFSNQLSHLLQHSLSSVSTATNVKPSLLHQMIGVFNPLNGTQGKRYSELSKKLAEILSKLRNVNHNTKAANHRITFLDNALHGVKTDSTLFDEDFMTEDVVPVLQEVGRAKELNHLKSLVVTAESTCNLLKVEIDALTEDMTNLGCMSSGIERGHVDGALNWLHSRELGLTSFGTGSGSALGRALVPSASSMRNKIMSHFRVLYTVSGHMMNPAYCCVFDQTGRYLLTGADDYLVKIWDVEKGQLIKTCKGHMGYISLVAVSPDNSLFASACTMGTIRIWRLSDGLCLQVFKHNASVNWIKFDRTSCALASASDDGQCIVWDLSKLLPEDAGAVPILDVIWEDRAAAMKAREEAGVPKSSREVDQLNLNLGDDLNVMEGEISGADVVPSGPSSSSGAPSSSGQRRSSSTSSSTAYAAHAGEERLASAISHSAEVQFAGGSGWNNGVNAAAATGNGALHAPIQHFNSRGGLFRWSGCVGADNNEDTDAMLVLHHIQDILQSSSEGDPLKVNCLDVSPMGNILVTGCEDGVARVWRIGDPEPIGAYTTRTPKLPYEGLLQKLKTIVPPSEFSRLKRVAAHLLMRLEGHVSPITDIHLNHLGDRVLTGSAQDCSVRIWSISRDLLKSVQVVLDLTEDEEDQGGEPQQSRVRGGRNNRSRLKSLLYNACWTADSTKIVTIQSVVTGVSFQSQSSNGNVSDKLPTRLKVWDAMTGDLLRVIWKISDISCRTLCKHPLNPSVVMTCGEDGFINVWDIDQEERLSCTRLLNDDKTPAKIVDASFSDDGSRLAVTDFVGRLSVLGLDDPERYNKVLTEQYFSTDYLDIMLDNVGFAIDVGTQMPVHEAPIGPLIRLDGTPYANQPAALQGPPATSKEDIRKMLSEIATDRKKGLKEMDRVFNTFTRNNIRGRLPKKYRGSKPKALRAMEDLQVQQQSQHVEGMVGANGRPLSDRFQYIEFDVNNYNPSTDDSEDSEFDLRADREARARGDEPDISRRHNFGQQRQSRRPRIATLRDSSSQRRSSRARQDIDYNDALEDNEYHARDTVASRAARASEREVRRRRQQLLHLDEFEDSDETEDSQDSDDIVYASDDDNRRATRSRRSGSAGSDSLRPRRSRSSKRGTRNARVIDDDDEEEEEGEPVVRETIPRPKKVKPPVFYRAKHGIVLGEGVEVGRKWLQTEESTPQYCPQMGDHVMYFPQGHIQWLQEFQESSSPPWMAFPQKWPVVECEVRNIQYKFPDTPQEHKMCCSVKALVELAVIRIPLRNGITSHRQYALDLVAPRATRNSGAKEITFTVTLRDWDMPDFLIPSDLFLRSIRLAWHEGVPVTVQFKNYSAEEKGYVFKSYEGKIAGITNASPEWPQSPWDCIEVTWDDAAEGSGDGASRVGPWEAVPQFSANSDYSRILQNYPLKKIDVSEATRIVEEIDKLMESEQFADLFSPFAYPVDPAVFPSYYLSIAVPICVETLRNRLETGYYRQLEALEYDVSLLYENCSNYNDEESPIVAAAAQLRAEFLKVIRPNGTVASTVVKETTSSSSRTNLLQDAPEGEVLTLRVRGVSSSSRTRGREQNDYLVDLVGANHSPVRRTRNISRPEPSAASEETILRIKRRRDPSPEPSPVKSHRASRSSTVAIKEEPSRSSRSRNIPETRPTRSSDSRTAQTSSSRNGRTRATVNYTEREEDEDEDDEDEDEEESEKSTEDQDSNDEEDGDADSNDSSDSNDDEDEDDSDEDNTRARSSRRASRSTRSQDKPSTSRSDRSRRSSESKRSKRDKHDKKREKHDVQSKSSKSSHRRSKRHHESDEERNDDSSDEQEEVVEEKHTTRSARIVRAPANFANDMAAAMENEYEKLQKQRAARRRSEEQRHQQEQEQLQAATHRSSRRVDPEMKRQMLLVLGHAVELDHENGIFAEAVTEDIAPGYFELIQHPVDLATMRVNINNRHYESVTEVIADLQQMYANCELYNDTASPLGEEASKQRADLKRFCRKNHLPWPA